MDLSAFMALAERCAPGADARPLIEIVRMASGFEALSLTIDGRRPIKILATSKPEAIELAMQAKIAKQDARLGLAGLTFKDLDEAGIGVADAFEPCPALRAAARILKEDPRRFAISRIARVQNEALAKRPADGPDQRDERSHREEGAVAEPETASQKPWDVFGNASGKSLLVYEASTSRR
ncbi:MAG: lytic transglycosylase domain-containing protein [Alphaproteobacteria bacterium]|nr:lytic transglycosylase domain-containing protein [Alphaproteobacteria bacterium]MBM3641134.1 lytic transglycosylase domain-containing protein [Alphaproteobacteria bacterium]